MNTHPTPETTDPTAEHWWPRLIDRINAAWIDREPVSPAIRAIVTVPPRQATATILATAVALAAAMGALVWWLLTALVGFLADVASGVGDAGSEAAHGGSRRLAAWSLTRTITVPVRTYLDQHATGLPATADLLWWTWLATTAGLFLLAMLGSRGARIGWTLAGAATAAMVYAGTPTTGRALAAGLTVAVWSVLSVPAFNRLSGETDGVTIIRVPLRVNDAPRTGRAD